MSKFHIFKFRDYTNWAYFRILITILIRFQESKAFWENCDPCKTDPP